MTGNGKLDEVFGEDAGPVSRAEMIEILTETEQMLQEMKDVINVHAEVIAAHKFVLERFVPKPLLAAAFKEYYEARKKAIDIETGTEAMDAGQAN